MSNSLGINKICACVCLLAACLLVTPGGSAQATTRSMTITAYSSDGQNTGTGRLGQTIHFTASVTGVSNPPITWTMQGAGTISSAGYYQAPSTMPSNPAVKVTGTLTSDATVTSSYNFSLVNPIPALYSAYTPPGQLQTDTTNPITVSGAGFVPQSVVYANGAAVATAYQSASTLTAQVAVGATAQGSVSITVHTAAPGGGVSGASSIAIAVDHITLYAYTSDGTNTATVRLGRTAQMTTKITGTPDTAVNWSVSGSGTITSGGLYQAPSAMPSNASVSITGTLASNPSAATSYKFSLINPIPALYSAYTASGQLQTDTTNPITVSGAGFISQSVVYANGAAIPTSFQSAGTLTAQVAVGPTAKGSVSVSVQNPSPGGGASSASSIPIAVDHITLFAYTSDGTNTGTVRLGRTAQMTTNVTGTPDNAVNWSVNGPGTITTAGLYQAPATMPATTAITITATLADNSAVYTAYQFSLIFPQPAPTSVYTATGPLWSGTSNSVTVAGAGFVPQSVVLVNGSSVAVTFQSSAMLTATVQVPAGAQGQMQFAVQNPAPGGNTSPALALGITPLVLKVGALSAVGLNPGTSRLGLQTQFNSTLTGSGSSTALAVTWSVSGGGVITANGLYTAPATMSGSSTAAVTAALALNSSVYAAYHLSLLNAVPVITHTSPTQVLAGTSVAVTLSGRGFDSSTTLTLNGVAIPATFLSGNALSASINVPAGQTGTVALVAQNPDPGGATSAPFALPVGQPASFTAQVNVTPGQQIPDDFLGMSYEWGSEASFQGTPATGINQIYRQLLTNLLQGHSKPMLIRIGGASSDHSAEPNASTLPAYISMASSMPVKFTMGVNLASNNSQLAQDQARYFGANMPTGSLLAIEIGNEPDLYPKWGARPSTYTVPDYLQEFSTFGAAVTAVVPASIGLMGPSWGDPNNNKNYFASFEQQEQHVSVASLHGYAIDTGKTPNPTPQSLLTNSLSSSLPSQDGPYVATAHQNGQLLRVGEMNSVDNSGVAGVSNCIQRRPLGYRHDVRIRQYRR